MPPDATRSLALLGPTNTGKTHKAVERMLEHDSGMIGLPLRLLAREIYDRVSARVGEDRVALITGEEKRVPPRPDYFVCTTEAMPLAREVDFLAVDEVQLATHDERGHVFTERLLHARGRRETWFMGAGTMRSIIGELVPAAHQEQHPRLSQLTFAGSCKLSRLRPRSAVVAFSLKELYSLAARLRALRGGTALVLGALSPRARNAQVALFQSGEVDTLVATDAVGMGLNLDVEHVAFASLRKFDGQRPRALDPAEIAQIAGRAGRFLRDGSFGALLPLVFDRSLALNVEAHAFESVRRVRYRNAELDFSTPQALLDSLRAPPPRAVLSSVPNAEDLRALECLLRDGAIARELDSPVRVELLWQVCQIPDFRRILFEVHLDLLRLIWAELKKGPLSSDFLQRQLEEFARLDGDADVLMARISRLRTWAFVANQSAWVGRANHIQLELSALEDRLSDALHAALVDRFVDRRARTRQISSPRPLRRNEPLPPSDSAFRPFLVLDGLKQRLAGGSHAVGPDLPENKLEALIDAPHDVFHFDAEGFLCGGGVRLGRLVRGASLSLPDVRMLAMEELGAGLRLRLGRRLLAFARDWVGRLFLPLRELERSERAPLRAFAYQLEQGLGTALRSELEGSIVGLDSDSQRLLGRQGVRIGALSVEVRGLTTPAVREQRARLVAAFYAESKLPSLSPPASASRGNLSSAAWLALGAIPLGPWVLRADLAERAARDLVEQRNLFRTLASLGVPRRERLHVASALGALLQPDATELCNTKPAG